MGTLFRIAWRNLLRGWRRSAIVISAIAVGLTACLVLVGWSHGWVRQIADTAVSTKLALLAVHAAGYQANPEVERTLADGGRQLSAVLETFPGARVSARVLGDALAQSPRQSARVALVGVDPAREARVSVVARSFASGGFPEPTPSGVARTLPGAAIGGELADTLRVKLGDKLVLHAPGENGLAAFRISGVFHSGSLAFDKSTVFLQLGDAQRLLGLGDQVHELAVALDDPRRLPELYAFAQAKLPAVRPGESVEVLTWKEREPRLAAILDLMTSTAWITYATLFAGMAFGIANALLMSVYERMREFGVLRSLGLPARDLVWMVLIESLLLTVGGAVLGVAIGAACVAWMGHHGVNLAAFAEGLTQMGAGATVYPNLERPDFASPVALAFLTAFVAAIWPAWQAARLRPAEALRHV
ncbi:MAG TPA: FtsX-like permease family protein [Myxococcota bacterium]|nr:FtsX-like permease family protein [Myxococcota bacterium]